MLWPLIQSPALEQSSRSVPTRSSGGPDFLPGIPASIAERMGESSARLTYPLSAATSPGAMAFTLIPRGPSSLARFAVSECNAYFETP
jgi:hypothetical protein